MMQTKTRQNSGYDRVPPKHRVKIHPHPKQPPQRHTHLRAHTASGKQTTQKATEVAILIDSNGKFINEEQLFPGMIWCPRAKDALHILSRPDFGSPKHIVIHTGTNDLREEQERVGGLLRRVAERASECFPSSKITILALLPHRDFHPLTIQRVNVEISRGCALLPNVHLAHHPTIGPWDLYDNVHLYKSAVGEFARTLKDMALSRRPGNRGKSSNAQQSPLAPPRSSPQHPARPRPIAPNKGPGHQPHQPPQPRPIWMHHPNLGKTAEVSELKMSRNKLIKNKDDNWFDTECQNIRKQLRKLSNQKHRDALNPDLRLSYCETLKHYKLTLRTKKALHTQKLNKDWINQNLKNWLFKMEMYGLDTSKHCIKQYISTQNQNKTTSKRNYNH